MEHSEYKVEIKRGRGRPRKEDIIEEFRPTRISVGESRSVLDVKGKDPKYRYYWVKDISQDGHRILSLKNAGYEFCRKDEGLVIGESAVYKSEGQGSMYRIPAGGGEEHLYLMRVLKDWHEEDTRKKQRDIDEQEKAMTHDLNKSKTDALRSDDGRYGEFSISR